MKNKLFRISLALFAALGILSCDTEPLDDGLGGQNLPTDEVFFAANYGSVQYKTANASAHVEGGILTVQANHLKGNFSIINQGALTGTYENSQTSFTYTETETGKVYSSVHPVTGESISTFTVTSINFEQQSISGSFQFVGYRMATPTTESTSNDPEEGDEPIVVIPGVEEVVFSQGTMLNIPYGGGIIDPIDPVDPVDPNDPNEPSSGDYFPMAVGNIWNYTNNAVLELGSTQVINGKTYYKQTNTFFADLTELPDTEEFLRKENGNYYSRVSSIAGAANPMAPQEVIILKDYLATGGTWTSTMILDFSQGTTEEIFATITLDNVIQQKDVTVTVNGIAYNNVIKVKSTNTSELTYNGEVLPGEGTTISYHWFAKDIGLIKTQTVDEGEPDEFYELISYDLN